MTTIYIGHYGEITIQDDPVLAGRLTTLRRRVSGNAANRPVGKLIFSALTRWEMAMRAALKAQHGLTTLAEYYTYTLNDLPLDDLAEAEQLSAAGQVAARAQGATFACRMPGCQHRVLIAGALCPRCRHDAD